MRLGAAAEAAGFTLTHRDVVASTMDLARERALAGADRLWIVADEQHGGRGRNGRTWSSPRGNLYASGVLQNPCATACAPQLGFVTGVALRAALSALAPHVTFRLKWPNDVLCNGAKLAGLLLEGVHSEGRFAVVLGLGVNCASHPPGLPYAATDLAESGNTIEPALLFAALSDVFARWLALWDGGAGFAAILDAWRTATAHRLGDRLQARFADTVTDGRYRGIDCDGRLILDTDDGLRLIAAGDVFPLESLLTIAPSREKGVHV